MLKLSRNQLMMIAAVGVLLVAGYYLMRVEGFNAEAAKLAKEVDLSEVNQPIYNAEDQNAVKQKVESEAVIAQAEQAEDEAADEGAELNPSDLLPNDDAADEWANANPKGTGSIELKNFVEAGYHIGVNTQASNTRNSNLGIRSEPPNPRAPVSIWNNSTIGPDPFRKPLEVGGDY